MMGVIGRVIQAMAVGRTVTLSRSAGGNVFTIVVGMALFGLIAATPACAVQVDPATQRREAAGARVSGRYDDALRGYRALADAPAEPLATARAADRRDLLRLLVELARYDETVTLGTRYASDSLDGRYVAFPVADALRARGRLDEAATWYERAAAGPDSLPARLALAELQLLSGNRARASRELDAFIDVYNNATGTLTSTDLAAIAGAVRQLGDEQPRLFRDALRAYDAAIAADSTNLDARIALGELFLEKYNGPDAAATLAGVLRLNPNHPRALLAEARRRYTDGEPGATKLVAQALEQAPDLVAAHVFRARLELDVENFPAAEKEAQRALEVDPASLDALALLAAVRHLRGDAAGVDAARQLATTRTSRPVAFFVTLADVAARNRLYADAVTFARQGVSLDSSAARAQAVLGVNLLRVGDMAGGRRALEAAFAGDPYDVWTKNTLDMLDAVRGYREVVTPHFRIVLDEREADLLAPYATALAEEAYARFAARYGWEPDGPIRVELYPRHADFSVRTVGLAGFGALGVSFGPVVAMDSPAARDAGVFNWGSTLWHEIAHTFTLGASRHRIPRWLSEGLSVWEERQARTGWGSEVSPEFLAAYIGGSLPPPSRLTDAFMRPAYPAQVQFAYVEASLVCQLIAEDHGAEALPRLVKAYGDGLDTPAAFQKVLGVTTKQFDQRFDEWIRRLHASEIAAVSPWRGGDSTVTAPVLGGAYADAMREAVAALSERQDDRARVQLERAAEMAPGATGSQAPRRLLAALHLRRGDSTAAATTLAAHLAVDEDDYEAQLQLADLHQEAGDTDGAIAALEATMWVSPYDIGTHERLAALYDRAPRPALAVRERRAVLALGPVDEAEARYQLARALHVAGDATGARREVLRALEIAPAFERAQALLLTLRSGGGRP